MDPHTWYKHLRLDLDVPNTTITSQDTPIMELMVNRFDVSEYKVGDYVLRIHPTTLGGKVIQIS